ncbi:MAG TPA: GAF domain-containing protein [Candidatus Limnocylindria bacterium]|jgi:hypothetical protein|nr:GAF domain-containing protein [Candidatus Limnocylindria bacterium]
MSTEPLTDVARADLTKLGLAELYELGDPEVRALLAEFLPLTQSSAIAIWVKDPEAEQLMPVLDTAGPEGALEMKRPQPLSTGIVSQVYRERKSFLESSLWRSKQRSLLVDQALDQETVNEMCVPFWVGGRLVGVVSAVQIMDEKHPQPKRWGFKEEDLQVLNVAAHALGLAMERAYWARRATAQK